MKKIFLMLMLLSFNAFAVSVNINTADAKTIAQSLNGVGMTKAEAIVKYREDHGAFKTHDELTKVKGIGEKTVTANKKNILFQNQ